MAVIAKKGLLFTYVSKETEKQIKQAAAIHKRSVSSIVRIVLEDWLAKEKGVTHGKKSSERQAL